MIPLKCTAMVRLTGGAQVSRYLPEKAPMPLSREDEDTELVTLDASQKKIVCGPPCQWSRGRKLPGAHHQSKDKEFKRPSYDVTAGNNSADRNNFELMRRGEMEGDGDGR